MAENTAALAETIETKKVTDLTEKTSPVDADLFTVGDDGTATLKKIKWSNLLTAIKKKIAEWTFDTLNTTDKTLPGGLNELRKSAYRIDNNLYSLGAVDLNSDTFWEPGLWKCPTSNAGNVQNIPVTGKSFKLIVESVAGETMQTLKYRDGRIYCRTKFSDGTINDWREVTNDTLDAAMKKRIIVGSTNDCMIVVTNQTLTFADGVATFNAKSIGTVYGKTISNALAQIKVAGGTVITSATVSTDGTVSVRAYNIGAGAAYAGDLVCTIVLFLS